MVKPRTVRIGQRLVGDGQPCFVIAEGGVNHNGDPRLATELVHIAARCQADAVKFQNYHAEAFVSDRSLTYEYISQGKTVIESQYDMFKRCELRPESMRELRQHCEERGVVFFSTPMDEEGVAELVREGAMEVHQHAPFAPIYVRKRLPAQPAADPLPASEAGSPSQS